MASKYTDILNYLIENIENKTYKKGDVLPTERELTTLFNVSRMTVRRALDELIDEGYALRKRGSGVYVSYQKKAFSADKISIRHHEDIIQQYGIVQTKIVEFKKIKANHLIKEYLSLDYDEEVYVIKRLQYASSPLMYEEIYLPSTYFHEFYKEECSLSIHELVSKYKKFKDETHVYQEIEVKLSNKKISELLEIRVDTPILQVANIVCLEQPVYFGINYYDGYKYKFVSGKKK